MFAHLEGVEKLPPEEQMKRLAQLKDRFRHIRRMAQKSGEQKA